MKEDFLSIGDSVDRLIEVSNYYEDLASRYILEGKKKEALEITSYALDYMKKCRFVSGMLHDEICIVFNNLYHKAYKLD